MTATADDTVIEVDVDALRRRIAGQIADLNSGHRAANARLTRDVERAGAKAAAAKLAYDQAVAEHRQAERDRQRAGEAHERTVDSLQGRLRRTAPAAIADAKIKLRQIQGNMTREKKHPEGWDRGQAVAQSILAALDRLDALEVDGRPASVVEAEVAAILERVARGELAPPPEPEVDPRIVELGQAISIRQGELRRAEYPPGDPRYVRGGQEMLRLNEVRTELRELCLRPDGRDVGAEVARLRERAGPGVGKAARRQQDMIQPKERPAVRVVRVEDDEG